jgi:iron complex transport system ATP-binding protein
MNLTTKFSVIKLSTPPLLSLPLSFDLPSGLHICLGKNGSGKTTLLRSLTAWFKQSQGQVLYFPNPSQSIDLLSLSPFEKSKILSYLPQNPPFNPYQRAIDCVLQGRYPYQSQESKQQSLDHVSEMMTQLSIEHLAHRQLKTLSGGERQKVLIARLFAQNTPILLIDEPLNHLDFEHQIDVLSTLQSLGSNENKVILCVMHDLNLSLQYGDSFLLMDQLQLKFSGQIDALLSSDPFKEIFGNGWVIGTHPISHKPYLFFNHH